jgi:hypothetical protein
MKLITLAATILFSLSTFAVDIPASKPVEQGYINFGNIPTNSARTQVLTLTNNSEEPLTGITAKISGYAFSLKNKCPSTLLKGESCKAKVTFWPSSPGGYSGRLYVTTSAKDYNFELYGWGERDQFPQPPPFPNPPIPPRP